MSVVAIVQCRVGSSRLPGKALRVLSGETMVRHVLRRVASLGYEVVVATSLSQRDDLLAEMVRDYGYRVFRGSEWDVLSRVAGAVEAIEAESVIRVTADCPLWAPDVARRVVDRYVASGARGIVTNDTTVSGWADGLDVEIFSAALLAQAARYATERADREHVTPWIRRHAPHVVVGSSEDWRRVKLSVDTLDDFERVRDVMANVNGGGYGWAATRAALVKMNLNAWSGGES